MHPPATVMVGALDQLDQLAIINVLNERLCKSSHSQIETVRSKWWSKFLLHKNYDFSTIPAGSPARGGIMASFALYMARAGLKYGTLQGYIWAICEYHIQLGGIVADPLDNVQDWSRFMAALEVQAWVDSSVEPHEMVPFQLFVRTLCALDRTDHNDVMLGVILVFMYFTAASLPPTRAFRSRALHPAIYKCVWCACWRVARGARRHVRLGRSRNSTVRTFVWGWGSGKLLG